MSRTNMGMADLRLEYVISITLFSLSIKAAENSAKDEGVGENMSPSPHKICRELARKGRQNCFFQHSLITWTKLRGEVLKLLLWGMPKIGHTRRDPDVRKSRFTYAAELEKPAETLSYGHTRLARGGWRLMMKMSTMEDTAWSAW